MRTRFWRRLEGDRSASGRTLPGIEARTPSDQRERPWQKVASHLWATAAVVILAAAVWYGRSRLFAPPSLPTTAVERGDLSEYVSCRGTLSAQQAAVLITPNRVESLRIIYQAPGDSEVKKGQVVVRLDVSALQQKASQLALALKTARAKLSQAEAQAQLTQQKDLLAIVQDQVNAGLAANKAQKASVQSRIAGQEADAALATAQAVVASAQAASRLDATAAAAQLQSLREARDQAAAQLQREQAAVAQATLRAPSAGLVTYEMNYSNYNDQHTFRVGDVVSAGDEIAQIPNLQSLQIDASLPQTERGQVRVGQAITAQSPALPEVQLTGHVLRISALTSLDFRGSFPPPRVFYLTASLDHPDARLRPQMTVTVKIIIRQLHHVPLIPARALFTHDGRAIVYVARNGRYQPQRVTVLGRNPTEVAIQGVPAGVRVALVQPGAKSHTPNQVAASPTLGAVQP